MKLSELSPNPQNPRKISDKKLEMLKKALLEFGDLGGVVFNKRTNQLVGGHQRLKAFKDSEIHMVTPSDGYFISDGNRFSFRIVEWDEVKEKAANIAANKGAGEWDFPQLNEWMIDLDAHNIDLDLTMFDPEERENMIVGSKFEEPPEKEEPNLKDTSMITCPNCGVQVEKIG